MKNLCIVIPTLNSAGHIRATVSSAFVALDACGVEGEFEIVAVDDGSSDSTLAVLEDIARNDARLKVVGLARNFGQHAAIFAGCRYSDSNVVLFTDDDVILTPERIDALFAGIQRGADVVLGVDDTRHRSDFRRVTSRLYNKFMRSVLGFSSDAAFSNLWMATELMVRQMSSITFPFLNVMGVVAQITSRIESVPLPDSMPMSAVRKSNYSFSKLVGLAMNGLIGYSVIPLRMVGALGFFGSVVSLFFVLFFVANSLAGNGPPEGYTTIMMSIWGSTSLLLLVIGAVGEYVGRMFSSISGRPIYVVRTVVNT